MKIKQFAGPTVVCVPDQSKKERLIELAKEDGYHLEFSKIPKEKILIFCPKSKTIMSSALMLSNMRKETFESVVLS